MALKHIGQGSQLVYNSHPDRSKFFSFALAARMASISAWAVGSQEVATRFVPSPIISPSLTTTDPKGPPSPSLTF